jgi:hypothetical protein
LLLYDFLVANQPERPSAKDFLSHLGISSDFVQKVRFRGPVGKLALVCIICVLGVGGIGIRSSDATVQLLSISLAAAITLLVGAGILWYSAKYPDQATLEGMEVVVMQRQKAWAAKGMTGIPNSPVISDPSSAPPQLNPPENLEQ